MTDHFLGGETGWDADEVAGLVGFDKVEGLSKQASNNL